MKLSVAKEICAMTEREIEQTFVNSGEYTGPKGWIEEIKEHNIRENDVMITVVCVDDGTSVFDEDQDRIARLFVSKKPNGFFHGSF